MSDILSPAAPRTVAAQGLSLAYDGRVVVPGLDLELATGRITAIVGANGSGKSTLLRGLARLLKPQAGVVTLDGEDVRGIPGRRLARMLGILPQEPVAPDGITVADLVMRGRHPHQGVFGVRDRADDAVVAEALRLTDALELAGMRVAELSGGQRQRVWIAMALAQNPDVLLLDEPTTFLDIAHQVDVLDLLADLNARLGTTVVMVLHDLNLAARYADELVVMSGGRLLASGSPAAVITEPLLAEAFGLTARVIADPVTGSPLVVPITHRRTFERKEDR
ncbi:ABC transporter ATP-binding protein [Gryllotalpicola ginsengisoli]|uniref:ABC transporter ATP-binding protein n=1 Tax=Gryllotalpicola ginsengisoli TaxID=444608 RepID=UPI0003B503D9|nr:ABC transporter ATP-binding protein [Gryllotalpicola ginsengisoli]